jgi:N-acyl-L-homoserine lactone synthetase
MIRFLYADQLGRHGRLAAGMFRDRTAQFSDRLAWALPLDEAGCERDLYDGANPLYLIAEAADGSHLGSLRFLPTTGATMVNDHFRPLIGGGTIRSPLIWEATRFCIAPGAPRATSAGLMAAAAVLGRRAGLTHVLGVFGAPMLRVYRGIGWLPEVLGRDAETCVGLWDFADPPLDRLCRKASLDAARLGAAADRDLGPPVPA